MGSIQGLDVGIGTILGMLLRGYLSGQQQDEQRKALEQRAQQLGLPSPTFSEKPDYLQRVLNPQAGTAELRQQATLMDLLQKVMIQNQMEASKQGMIGAREQQLAGTNFGYNQQLAQQRAAAGVDLEKLRQQGALTLKQTPGAPTPQTPEERALTIARMQEAQMSARQQGMMTNWFENALRQIAGKQPDRQQELPQPQPPPGGAPLPQPPNVGQPTTQRETSGLPGLAPGYETVPEWTGKGFALRQEKTLAKQREEARALTQERELAQPLSDTMIGQLSQNKTVVQLSNQIQSTILQHPEYLELEYSKTLGAREVLGQSAPAESLLHRNLDRLILTVKKQMEGARSSDLDQQTFQNMLDIRGVRNPRTALSIIQNALEFADTSMRESLRLATTPRGAVQQQSEATRLYYQQQHDALTGGAVAGPNASPEDVIREQIRKRHGLGQ